MKKFILICRHYLAEILLALVSLIVCVAGLFFTSRFDILFGVFIVSVVAYVVAMLFLINREKPQGSFTASIEGDSKDDPLPEPAESCHMYTTINRWSKKRIKSTIIRPILEK